MADSLTVTASSLPTPTPISFEVQAGLPADTVVIMLTTAPDELLAKRIGHILVEEHLAACVHVSPVGVSMYMWQGTLEGGPEVAMTLKTTQGRSAALAQRLSELHPYEVPEVLVLPVLGGASNYLAWVREQVREDLSKGSC